jgi:phosphoadenosine phosphosulfate reductase
MSGLALSEAERAGAASRLSRAQADEILDWVEERFGPTAVLASSFGAEDVVLIDLASRHAPSLRIFTLDTGRLHPETFEVMEAIRARYAIVIETYAPERRDVEALESAQGYFSFRQSVEKRKACCALRKVEPLGRALAGRAAWVTGLRREQSVTRADLEVVQRDAEHGQIAKVSPLASWSTAEVWAYIREHEVPYNPLHDRGFSSIGCAPCTRAIKPYEDLRAGRWWWEAPDQKECGLHARTGTP